MSRRVTLPVEPLDLGESGTPHSARYGDVYHPAEGGLAQARHVFLGGNRLPARWAGRDHFVVLETGFGIGLNFLATWHAWRCDPRACARLHFVSVEAHPLSRHDVARALSAFTEVAPLGRELAEAWPLPVAGFHRLAFEGGQVMLTLLLGDAAALLPSLVGKADAIFLDGFAPARNPAIWSPEVMRELGRLAMPGATLATWSVAVGVREALDSAGFRVAVAPGVGRKREMLVGERVAPTRPAQLAPERRAAIVGAGLAGALCAERLVSRGWSVTLVDERPVASAAAAGLLRPVANSQDSPNAQASRPAFGFALRYLQRLSGPALHWSPTGILQLAATEAEAERQRNIASQQAWPEAWLRFVEADEAAQLAGRAVRGPGWWIPAGAWVSPASLVSAAIARGGARITRCAGRAVHRIEGAPSGWRLLDADDKVVAEAPVVIVANAHRAARLVPGTPLPLSPVRGQVTDLPADPARPLRVAVSGNGYIAPTPGGGHVVGASFAHDDESLDLRDTDHRENLARAESMLPGFTQGIDAGSLAGWAGVRATVTDRLPVFGESAEAGLWFATGLGSRGLLWAPLGAELIASALEGEPLPLPSNLVDAFSPRRFAR